MKQFKNEQHQLTSILLGKKVIDEPVTTIAAFIPDYK